jgi:hypothetical protein
VHLVVYHLPGDDGAEGLLRLQLQGVRSLHSVAEQLLQRGGVGFRILKYGPQNETSTILVEHILTWTSPMMNGQIWEGGEREPRHRLSPELVLLDLLYSLLLGDTGVRGGT